MRQKMRMKITRMGMGALKPSQPSYWVYCLASFRLYFYSAVERLLGHTPLVMPSPIAMGFAALAIIGKEALYQYTIYVAKRIQSPMLKASAWHHRSDAILPFWC